MSLTVAARALGLAASRSPSTRGLEAGRRRLASDPRCCVPLHRSRMAYYDLLRISPACTQSQVKAAYYRQSFLFHPDKNPGSERAALRFTQIGEAYSVLSNGTLRRKYDRGVLSLTDLQAARKAGRSDQASPRPEQRPRPRPGPAVFDFDEFYRAHYGEQLERERGLRWRRERYRRERGDPARRWQLHELPMFALLFAGVALLSSLRGGKQP